MCAYPLLELGKIGGCEGISLCDHRDKVDTSAELLHDLNVERLQAVASRTNEVQACVHTKINLLSAARLLLLEHVALMLVVKEFNDWLP